MLNQKYQQLCLDWLNHTDKVVNLISKFFLSVIHLPNNMLSTKDNSIVFMDEAIFEIDDEARLPGLDDKFANYVNNIFSTLLKNIAKKYDYVSPEGSSFGTPTELWQESFECNGVLETDYSRKIKEKILDKNYFGPLVVCGESSSGKTTSTRLALANENYIYIDMATLTIDQASFLTTLINLSDGSGRTPVIIDNVQASPSNLEWIPGIFSLAEKILQNTSFLPIFLTWPNAFEDVKKMYPKYDAIFVDGNVVTDTLINDNNIKKYEDDIKRNCRGDVLVTKRFIDYTIKNEGKVPNRIELAKDIYLDSFSLETTDNDFLTKDENEALFILSSINQFEIYVEKSFFKEPKLIAAIEKLKSDKHIRYYIDEELHTEYYSVGHRSKAYFIYIYLKEIAKDSSINRNERYISSSYASADAKQITIDYLKEVGFSEQLYFVLQRLDLNKVNKTYSHIWKRFEKIKENFKKQCENDATWGNNMASMVFACCAVAAMKYEPAFSNKLKVIENEICSRWDVSSDNKSLVFVGEEMTAEMADFTDKIHDRMLEDEKNRSVASDMLASKIDYSLFHHSWLLGLLLDEAGLSNNRERIDKLVTLALNMQEIDGNFYPNRVSWVTARVILGLTDCGYTYSSNQIVKDACDWLASEITNDITWEVNDMKSPGWYSGTGTWNSNEQITIMNLVALLSAQYPIYENELVKTAVNEFIDNYKELDAHFKQTGAFLDSMWIASLMSKAKISSDKYLHLLLDITKIALDNWDNATKGVIEKDNESSDMAFLAKELLDIIWKVLSDNIGEIIGGLDFAYKVEQKEKQFFISYRRDKGDYYADDFYEVLNAKFPDDVFLDKKDLNLRPDENGFFEKIAEAINGAKFYILILTYESYERALEQNYKKEDDILYREIKTALERKKQKGFYIIPVVMENKYFDNIHKIKNICPEFYDMLMKVNEQDAIVFDRNASSARELLVNKLLSKIKSYI